MSWKAANYNELRADFDRLRDRYQELQLLSRQHNEQMASLETLATEVSVAYGFNKPGPSGNHESLIGSWSSTSSAKESVAEYNFLKSASFGGIYHRYAYQWQLHARPSLWPLDGVLRSSFGGRSDPFSGEGAFHTGIDISAPIGTPVHVTADGVVVSAGWAGGYGKLVVVDHGNGFQTYYAHLSQLFAVPGEEVSRGQVIAYSGSTGKSTGPHMHYEVRLAGTPVNPYKYLGHSRQSKTDLVRVAKTASSDLGL
ncbi:MAG: M23 family metallopeptidase [Acidobacteriaceae bacterium]|nr:M23 family metallopeptidase [Acidobacteriaceae bacterium]